MNLIFFLCVSFIFSLKCVYPNCADCDTEPTCGSCSKEFVWVGEESLCVRCTPGECFRCPTKETCSSCEDGFVWNTYTSQCGKCSAKDNLCMSCPDPSSCNTCSQAAEDSFSWDDDRGKCVMCSYPFCQNCPDESTCNQCDVEQEMWTWNDDTESCDVCRYPSCWGCSSQTRCDECGWGEFLFHEDDSLEEGGKCIRCGHGFCSDCQTGDTCDSCNSNGGDFVWAGGSASTYVHEGALECPGMGPECSSVCVNAPLSVPEENFDLDEMANNFCWEVNASYSGIFTCYDNGATMNVQNYVLVLSDRCDYGRRCYTECPNGEKACCLQPQAPRSLCKVCANENCEDCFDQESCSACSPGAIWSGYECRKCSGAQKECGGCDTESTCSSCSTKSKNNKGTLFSWNGVASCEICDISNECRWCNEGDCGKCHKAAIWDSNMEECEICGKIPMELFGDDNTVIMERCHTCPTESSCESCSPDFFWDSERENCDVCGVFSLDGENIRSCMDCPSETDCKACTGDAKPGEKDLWDFYYGMRFEFLDDFAYGWYQDRCTRQMCPYIATQNECDAIDSCGWGDSSDYGYEGCTWCTAEFPGYGCMLCPSEESCTKCGSAWGEMYSGYGMCGACPIKSESPIQECFMCPYSDECFECGGSWNLQHTYYGTSGRCGVECKDPRCSVCATPYSGGDGYMSYHYRNWDFNAGYCVNTGNLWNTFEGKVIYDYCFELGDPFTHAEVGNTGCINGCHKIFTISYGPYSYDYTIGSPHCDLCFHNYDSSNLECMECDEGFMLVLGGNGRINCEERPASTMCENKGCLKCDPEDDEVCWQCHQGYELIFYDCIPDKKVNRAAIIGGILGGIFGALAIVCCLVILIAICICICICICVAKKKDDEMELEEKL